MDWLFQELLAVSQCQDLLCREQSLAWPQPLLLCVLLLGQLSVQPGLLCWCFLQANLHFPVLPLQALSPGWPGAVLAVKEVVPGMGPMWDGPWLTTGSEM